MRPLAARWLLLLASLAVSVMARAEPPLADDDRIRLAEAWRLADDVQDSVWPGWSEVPFVVLLVTPETEYLLRHPAPTDDFSSQGFDDLLQTEVFARANTGQYDPGILATFPAISGVDTVVIGQPAATGKKSTTWAIVALHEHFHQLQYTRPWYYDGVKALDLAGGDESGMWQLNYPFPYDDRDVGRAFADYQAALARTLDATDGEIRGLATDVDAARDALRQLLNDSDYRYLSFQLWQEGIARYTEYAVARAAVAGHEPLPAFTRLTDYVGYADALAALEADHRREMRELDLEFWKRTVFYPVGAAEGLLLDRVRPDWKARYFAAPFSIERNYTAE